MTVADFDAPAPEKAAPERMSPLRVTILCAAMVALGPLAMALYTPAMPAIGAEFGAGHDAVKMTLTAYFAGFATAQLVAGPLSDALGRKATLYIFYTLFSLATLWAVTAVTIEELIAARALQGIGASAGIAISRAVVRDLFTGDASSKIMNGIGLVLAVGPAIAPTIGGLTLEVLPWQAVFGLMLVYAVGVLAAVRLRLAETVTRDMSRFRPRALARNYATILRSNAFRAAALLTGGSMGAIYAQATILPFVLIDEVGLTPSQYGLAMILQTGSFFCGSLVMRQMLRRHSARSLAPVGLVFIALGGAASLVHLTHAAPTLLNVMGPIGLYAFGIAFVMPFSTTAALAPFAPRIAGAAAALTGFAQLFSGFVGGMLAALFADPALALGVVAPAMSAAACLAWIWWRAIDRRNPQKA